MTPKSKSNFLIIREPTWNIIIRCSECERAETLYIRAESRKKAVEYLKNGGGPFTTNGWFVNAALIKKDLKVWIEILCPICTSSKLNESIKKRGS